MSGCAAGAASVSLEPPLGLPMVGFVRRHQPAAWSAGDLEATAVVVEAGGARAVVVGIDTLAIQAPEVDRLRERVAAAAGAEPAAVLLNFNHTHCAPPASAGLARLGGDVDGALPDAVGRYMDTVADRVVAVAERAASTLEEARPAWAVGRCDEAVNRREPLPSGRVILGWNRDGIVDRDVPVLQLRRRDGSAIATVVAYGCHTVAVGPDVLAYSADYPGPMREAVRAWTGGECVFLQGAGGNALPRVAFAADLGPARRMGRRLALAALTAIDDATGWPTRYDRLDDGSVTPFHLYRPRVEDGEPVVLRACELDVALPLQRVPALGEVEAERDACSERLAAARARGADGAELNVIRYDLVWAEAIAAQLRDGTVGPEVHAPVHALRIEDGAIVTGPGEIFAEIGLAVRERSPAAVTAYAGYTNGLVSYVPSAAAFPAGGYEPDHGNRSFGLAAPVSPACDGILVRAGLDALGRLWPEWPGVAEGDDLLAGSGAGRRAGP